MRSPAEKEVQELKTKISRLRSEVGEVAEGIMHLGKAEGEELKEKIEEQLKEQIEALQAEFEEATGKIKRAAKAVEGQLREHPLLGILGAICVGFCIGKLLERKR